MILANSFNIFQIKRIPNSNQNAYIKHKKNRFDFLDMETAFRLIIQIIIWLLI